ncbi:electron transport complex subunit RsxD [Alteromonas sp. a30]|uniref:electron transport complex subunit RsxD n=1 Tax=Alteromonas sp. a30 TaxID=2730917 RepID=UPI002282BE99|nr:electron transport complex subunit RsxD [Alteromonas sp. a30]MCY7296874.1 electron transport complex subunit RsxD [Alteromonas sp. a30]
MSLFMTSSPHQHVKRSTATIMRLVMLCTVPGIAAQTYFFGWGTLIHVAIACTVAVVTEACILELRKRNIELAIKDSSALLTALLLAISIPPFAPWWVTVIGSFFAIAFVKQLYGGLGFNLFNPAMAAYVALLVSFPVQMTAWTPPAQLAEQNQSMMDIISIIFTQFSEEGFSVTQMRAGIDGFTMATPLDEVKTALNHNQTLTEAFSAAQFTSINGFNPWTWVSLSYLLGGLVLLQQRVISWHIPLSMLGGLVVIASVFYLVDADHFASPVFHLVSGSMIMGAFFIATDPVTAATSNKGRIIFGASIGLWVYIIRNWGGYPDAIAFAVVIMNMAVPVIDYYTKPKAYGHDKQRTHSLNNQNGGAE